MEPIDPVAARAALLEERTRLLGDLEETIIAPGQMTYGSQAAAATQVFEQQRDLALRDRGTFGACRRCGKPIAAGRLEALPWAAYCIECQRAVDRGER